jgi:hypothetical protein
MSITTVKGMTTMIDEYLARLRTHRNNIHRYRRLLVTQLTELERQYLEERLAEEECAMQKLSATVFPITLGTETAPPRPLPDVA